MCLLVHFWKVLVSILVDYTSDFPLLPLPKLQQQQIPNHPKIFFFWKAIS